MCSVYLRTKHLRTCVNLVDVDQNPRPDFVSIKGCFVFTESEEKRSQLTIRASKTRLVLRT